MHQTSKPNPIVKTHLGRSFSAVTDALFGLAVVVGELRAQSVLITRIVEQEVRHARQSVA